MLLQASKEERKKERKKDNKGSRTISKMAYQLLSDLNTGFRYVIICVRVSRMWDFRGAADDGPIKHVDLILIDQKGNHMYAEIGKNNIEAKKPLLEEGKVYVIKKIGVYKARSDYRVVESSLMIRFDCHTTIEEMTIVPAGFPMYTYNLTPFKELPSYVGKIVRFIDVIGAVIGISDSEWVQAPGKNTPSLKRIVVLKDTNDNQLKVTLWGQRADEFDGDTVYEIGQKQPVIVIFVGCLMKNYGEDTLSGNSACRWYINETIPDIHNFYARYKLCLMAIDDGTTELEFILFGDVAREIIKKQFSELQGKMHDPDIPAEITNIISQKFTFAVSISSNSYDNYLPSFEVKKIITQFGKLPKIPAVQPEYVGSSSATAGTTSFVPLTPIKSLSPQFRGLQNVQQESPLSDKPQQCDTTQKRGLE